MAELILPDWPLPKSVKACSTTRNGGVSQAPYDSFNLGLHVGDASVNVANNRHILINDAQLPNQPVWLEQEHGNNVLTLTGQNISDRERCADAAYSNKPGQVCAVMTADCLPVLFCSKMGDEVAAAHAGWRGLCAGILEKTVATFQTSPNNISAWLGPAIGPTKFEVGEEVRTAFITADPLAVCAFKPYGGKFLANIYLLARLRLKNAGVSSIYGGERCTVSEISQFFSYRRDGLTGRMASLVWLL